MPGDNWIRITIERSSKSGEHVDGIHRVSYQSFGEDESAALEKCGDTLGFVIASAQLPRPMQNLAAAIEYLVTTEHLKGLVQSERALHDAARKVIEFWEGQDKPEPDGSCEA